MATINSNNFLSYVKLEDFGSTYSTPPPQDYYSSFDLNGGTYIESLKLSDVSDSEDVSEQWIPDEQKYTPSDNARTIKAENNIAVTKHEDSSSETIAVTAPPVKKKTTRTIYSEKQLHQLEIEFSKNRYLVKEDRLRIMEALNLTDRQIKVWFQNRRQKEKREYKPKFTKRTSIPLVSPYSDISSAASSVGYTDTNNSNSATSYSHDFSFEPSSNADFAMHLNPFSEGRINHVPPIYDHYAPMEFVFPQQVNYDPAMYQRYQLNSNYYANSTDSFYHLCNTEKDSLSYNNYY